MSTTPAIGANYENYLIGVQSVIIDPLDSLWILDTGRTAMRNGTNVPSSVGGPKLIGVNLTSNTILKQLSSHRTSYTQTATSTTFASIRAVQ
ncbi:hypothetical protein ABVK25_009588 [Lepraria finkii]|uniref:Major royal jelly protein n=1 Tax=Lepraria finkii TaxID=1340010 RepID=A0ABR4AX32_9LECA